MKTILVIAFTDLRSDPRVRKELRALSAEAGKWQVTTVGKGDPEIEGVRFLPVPQGTAGLLQKLRKGADRVLRRFDNMYWSIPTVRAANELLKQSSARYDLVIANDLETLPLALRYGKRVIFDAHEFTPLEFEDNLSWKLMYSSFWDALCRRYIPRANVCITVAPGIAETYESRYGNRFQVITNTAPFADPQFRQTDKDRIRLVLHGNVSRSRNSEKMLALSNYLEERFEMHLYPTGNQAYIRALKDQYDNKVVFHSPVLPEKIVPTLSKYDIGVYLLPPNSFNNCHALPNKFFEFVQAGLAVGIGPSVEMEAYVKKYKNGIVAKDFQVQSLGNALNRLTPQEIDRMKTGSIQMAAEENAEKSQELLMGIIKALLEGR